MSYLAIDLGASHGRLILFTNVDEEEYEVIHRFKHSHINEHDIIYLNFDYTMKEIIYGIKKAFDNFKTINAIGINTWGVDYGYLTDNGELLNNPIFYKSDRTKNITNDVFKIIDKRNLYEMTGIQHLHFNTIFQMYHDKKHLKSQNIKAFLMLPDLIAYYLTGKSRNELTNLSTTGLINPNNLSLINQINDVTLGNDLFQTIIYPGEQYGITKKDFSFPPTPVVAVASHDTASAVASLPIKSDDIYLSSGSWSLIGVLLDKPLINDKTFTNGFTNEIGLYNKIRFLKNIPGLYIATLCFEEFKQDYSDLDYNTINELANKEPLFETFIDVYHPMFDINESAIGLIKKYCKLTNQKEPQSIGAVYRIIYDSLVMTYYKEIKQLESITKRNYKNIFVVGGGSKIDQLNQMLACITNKNVIIGSEEATALGNALVQREAIEGIKPVTSKSYTKIFKPKNDIKSDYIKFIEVLQKGENI